jgi:hypothetical protein
VYLKLGQVVIAVKNLKMRCQMPFRVTEQLSQGQGIVKASACYCLGEGYGQSQWIHPFARDEDLKNVILQLFF